MESAQSTSVQIAFPTENLRRQNVYAEEVADLLKRNGFSADEVRLVKEAKHTLDAGTIVSVVLGSASVVALASGIGSFIAKRGTRIRIKMPDATSIEIDGDPACAGRLDELIRRLRENA